VRDVVLGVYEGPRSLSFHTFVSFPFSFSGIDNSVEHVDQILTIATFKIRFPWYLFYFCEEIYDNVELRANDHRKLH